MTAVQRAEHYLKALQVGDKWVRRNPLLYGTIARQFRWVDGMGADERREWLRERLRRSLQCASSTAYGRRVGGGADLASWPLLTKETVRDDPASVRTRAPR